MSEEPEVKAEPEVPKIILKLTDVNTFNVEIDFRTPSLQMARAMLREAACTIQSLIDDAESLAFEQKMRDSAKMQLAAKQAPKIHH